MATSPKPLSEAKGGGKRTARIGRATWENALRRQSAAHPAVPTAGPTLEYPHTGYQPLSSAISLGGAFDRSLHAATARITMGLSPAALMAASMDWMINLASSPGRQMELIQEAAQLGTKFANYAMHCGAAPSIKRDVSNHRRMTSGSLATRGSNGHTILSPRAFCFRNSGGYSQPSEFVAFQSITRCR